MRTGCSFVFSRGLEVVLHKAGTGVSEPWKSIYFPESLIIKELHIPIDLEAPVYAYNTVTFLITERLTEQLYFLTSSRKPRSFINVFS